MPTKKTPKKALPKVTNKVPSKVTKAPPPAPTRGAKEETPAQRRKRLEEARKAR
jgi:hypothetical protein